MRLIFCPLWPLPSRLQCPTSVFLLSVRMPLHQVVALVPDLCVWMPLHWTLALVLNLCVPHPASWCCKLKCADHQWRTLQVLTCEEYFWWSWVLESEGYSLIPTYSALFFCMSRLLSSMEVMTFQYWHNTMLLFDLAPDFVPLQSDDSSFVMYLWVVVQAVGWCFLW